MTTLPKSSRRNATLVLGAIGIAVSVVAAQSNATRSTQVPRASATSAYDLSMSIPVRAEVKVGYQRELFKHWVDDDSDGCDTRDEVLIRDSSSTAQVDRYRCKVIEGDWYSPYDGVTHTDPSDLDIDHVVALKEAWDSGANVWSSATRQRFANDMSDRRTLIAVTDSVNRSKSDRDPSNWLPPNRSYICEYLGNWVAVKARWGLSMDQSEAGRVRKILSNECAGTTIAPIAKVNGVASVSPTSTVPVRNRRPATTVAPRARTSVPSTVTTVRSTVATVTTLSTLVTTTSSIVTTKAPSTESGATVSRPGAFCSPAGARGTYNGRAYTCTTSPTEARNRWRQP